jgi:hypothetical protein
MRQLFGRTCAVRVGRAEHRRDHLDLRLGNVASSCGRSVLSGSGVSRFFDAYEQADDATITRARGWAVLRALNLVAIGQNGRLGLPAASRPGNRRATPHLNGS